MVSHLIDDESNKDVRVGKRLSLLEGVKVLDLTRALAGPFGVMCVADMGADVTKVEPLTGDPTRQSPPYKFEDDSAYFITMNRNKKSVAIDIRTKDGYEILSRLIERSDVMFDNLRIQQRKKLGLSFPDLEKINPKIVSCSLTGFGSDGPYSERPGYDIIVEAMAGVMSLTGPTGGPSVRAGVPIGDIVAGMYAAMGALAGLEYRRANDKGTHIDIGMLDCQVSLLNYLGQYYLTNGVVSTHQGRGHVGNPLYNAFETKDSEFAMNGGNDEMFAAVCKVLGRDDLVTDARFGNRRDRVMNRGELEPILQEEFKKWTTDDIYAALVDADVAVGPINNVQQALHDPHVRHRDMVVRVPHRSGKEFLSIGSAIKSEDAIGKDFVTPPGIGSDTSSTLHDIGYSDDEIKAFDAAGVIKVNEG